MLVAFLLTVAHLAAIVAWTTPAGGWQERYHTLVGHDSYWFLNIIDRGYRSPVPPAERKQMEISNVAFFPGFPLLAKGFIHGFGLHEKTGLLMATHLSTWGFWTYVLLWMRRWRWGRRKRWAAIGLILAHPAAMFMIAGYSESLFLLMLLGFMFWSTHPARFAPALAALHGFAATATRIAGVPAAVYPVLDHVLRRWRGLRSLRRRRTSVLGFTPPLARLPDWLAPEQARAWLTPALVSGCAMLGAGLFFLFCHLRFGHWDFYMMTQQSGWGVRADYLALLKPGAYANHWVWNWDHASEVGQLLVPLTMLGFAGLGVWEWRAARGQVTQWRERAGFYFVAFVLFFIAVSGVYSVNLESMTRYHFCSHVFLVLAGLHAWRHIRPRHPRARRLVAVAATIAALFSLYLHYRYAVIFTRGGWVA